MTAQGCGHREASSSGPIRRGWSAVGWDERAGRVSQAFAEWRWIDRDQRAFLEIGSRFAQEAYRRLWEEAKSEPWYDGGPELLESFEDRIEGLWEHDFEWMHHAGVLRDAVTNFEVYLEKAREEVRHSDGEPTPVPSHSPSWKTIRTFFQQRLALDLETPEIRKVRNLRHFLTHRRGELRTEELRKQFAAETAELRPINVELPVEVVIAAMDDLAEAVCSIDAGVYAQAWGQRAS